MTVCRACGFHNEVTATFCGSCGAYLEWTGEGARPEGGPAAAPPISNPPSSPSAATPPMGTRAVHQPPSVHLEPPTAPVTPGGEVTVRLDAHNRSGVVDQFTADISGLPPGWVDVQPPVLSLFPDDRGSMVIAFRPPRASAPPAGAIAFRIVLQSVAEPSMFSQVDGVLELGAFTQLAVEVAPHTSRGRFAGKHRLTVRNEGNVVAAAVLTGRDPDNALAFRFRPDVVRPQAGAKAEADVRAKPRKRIWLGSTKWHRFAMVGEVEGSEPIAVEAVMEQNKILPRWLPRAAVGLVVLAVGAVVLRSTVFKPKTEAISAAQTTTVPALPSTTTPIPTTTATTAVQNTVVSLNTTSTTTTTTTLPKVLFTSFRTDGEQVWTMNDNGSTATKLTSGGTANGQAAWSPDRKSIAFVSRRDGNSEIYIMNANGSGQRRLTTNTAIDIFPRWSPDGTRIAFASDRPPAGGGTDIWVVNADGSGPPTDLTNSPGTVERKPTWSPDGTKIAFERGAQIFVVPAAGGPATLLVAGQGPSWSPDGTKIAFSNGTHLFTIAPTGGATTQLTSGAGPNVDPSWAADGKRVVFTSSRDGNEEIYIMQANGDGQTRLTNTGGGFPENQDQLPQL